MTKTNAYLINTYYYPKSKSLGKDAVAMVLLMDRYTVRDITKYEMTLVATNNQNQWIKVVPELLKEQLNEACRYVNVVAIANVLPGMTKLEISDGTTSMEVPFKAPSLSAPSPVIICISPQFIAEQWQTFIAHVHVARRFGGHLHLYVTSMLDSFFNLVTEYEKLGYVTVDFWVRHEIPEVNEESELRNQAGAQTDCLLQYKEAAEFVAFFDLDDILFPVHQNDYLNEFRMLYSIHPDILTFHYNKRETIAHNKAVISDINFFDLFNHTWFVNEEDYGKTVTRPENLNSMWIHEPFNIPYSRKHTVKDNHLVHIQKPVDSDGKETIPWRLSNFERMEEMRKNETVLGEIQEEFHRLLNSTNILQVAEKLPKLSYYFPIIYRCYYEKFYKKFREECPNGEGCIIPQRSDLNCVHSEVDYQTGPPMHPITYHYHRNPRWVRMNGCHA